MLKAVNKTHRGQDDRSVMELEKVMELGSSRQKENNRKSV